MDTNNLCMGCMREKGEGMAKCLKCGYIEGSPYLPSYLAPKTMLQERYLIGKVLSYNGSGATYIAFDCIMNCKVKVREYMPENLASREKGEAEIKANAGSEIQFKSLKQDFISLARTLVKLNSLSEVEHVNDIFEANNTVYVVYEFIEGMTLTEFLKKNGGYLSWEDAKQLFMPLLSCMGAIHTSEILHRGISPETIMVDRSGNLKLTGFDIASARTARSELVAQLFAGYSAPEQYSSSAWQGTFTDVYALAACIYRAITGTMPVEAISRVSNDNLVAASSLNSSIPINVSNAVTSAMALSPEKRTQTVASFISQLSETLDFGAASMAEPVVSEPEAVKPVEQPVKAKKKKSNSSAKYMLIAIGITIPVLVLIAFFLWNVIMSDGDSDRDNTSSLGSYESSSYNSSDYGHVEQNISVPNFVGNNINSIQNNSNYKQMYTFVIVEEFSEKYEAGRVVEQSVKPNTVITNKDKGMEITLTVSRGSQFRTMPNLVGKSVEYAKDYLNDNSILYEIRVDEGNWGDYNEICRQETKVGDIIDITQAKKVILYRYQDLSEFEIDADTSSDTSSDSDNETVE